MKRTGTHLRSQFLLMELSCEGEEANGDIIFLDNVVEN